MHTHPTRGLSAGQSEEIFGVVLCGISPDKILSMTANPSTRDQLIDKLSAIQNTRAFFNVDILSIAGVMSEDQLEKYVRDKEREAADYSSYRQSFVITGK